MNKKYATKSLYVEKSTWIILAQSCQKNQMHSIQQIFFQNFINHCGFEHLGAPVQPQKTEVQPHFVALSHLAFANSTFCLTLESGTFVYFTLGLVLSKLESEKEFFKNYHEVEDGKSRRQNLNFVGKKNDKHGLLAF